MIKVGIIGSTGYAGGELVRLLMNHKEAEIKWFGSRSYVDKKYADVYQNFFQIVDDKNIAGLDGILFVTDFVPAMPAYAIVNFKAVMSVHIKSASLICL